MTQYVWLVGVSRVGKESFFEKMQENKELRDRFRINSPFGFTDTKVEDDLSFDQLEEELSKSECLIIKWQFTANCWLECLPRIEPKRTHRILRLRRRYEDIVEGVVGKNPAMTRKFTVEKLASEGRRIDALLVRVGKFYEVTDINATKWEYRTDGPMPETA